MSLHDGYLAYQDTKHHGLETSPGKQRRTSTKHTTSTQNLSLELLRTQFYTVCCHTASIRRVSTPPRPCCMRCTLQRIHETMGNKHQPHLSDASDWDNCQCSAQPWYSTNNSIGNKFKDASLSTGKFCLAGSAKIKGCQDYCIS